MKTPPKTRINQRDDVLMVVYVVAAGNFVKVGIAEDINARVQVLKTHCPLPVSVEFCSERMLRPKARELELDCHSRFSPFHSHGEWFQVSAKEVLAYLSGLGREDSPVQLRLIA